ncbi:protein phosphatase [Roseovarius sp. SCSIO 43702]|uniref:phosphatase domain-containing protein n=1 Tax=Roseovarius sp. SCSIO 43702 TaxID=2823043 RepID=UPI001C734072|nr:protein phosphatase [Roseovarius sp. SCSIO 43702]QYX57942.1 protein phosphatase [Roseovarius sp. SCSIO 43702]
MSFVIHAVPVAGGIVALAPFPGRGAQSFEDDMAHVRDWKPAIVMTLTTDPEMVSLGHPDLGHRFVGMGARWIHLPIEDYGVPEGAVLKAWPGAARAALKALGGGGRVLVHCKGGCGRSGMIVLKLMIAAGEAPISALERLRAVKPEAVETSGQMNWATAK